MNTISRIRHDQPQIRWLRPTAAAPALALRLKLKEPGRHNNARRHHEGRAAAAAPSSGSKVMAAQYLTRHPDRSLAKRGAVERPVMPRRQIGPSTSLRSG